MSTTRKYSVTRSQRPVKCPQCHQDRTVFVSVICDVKCDECTDRACGSRCEACHISATTKPGATNWAAISLSLRIFDKPAQRPLGSDGNRKRRHVVNPDKKGFFHLG